MRTRNAYKENLVKEKAVELLVKDGLEGFSVNKLARACKISVATIYIYYKDKDDLIIRISQEEGKRMADSMVKNFTPELSFEKGLKIQWQNSYQYMMENPAIGLFFDRLRSSTYQQQFLATFMGHFEATMSRFMKNVVKRGEIKIMPIEMYWSVAFSPLYSLIRFHNEGHSKGGRPFKMTEDILWKTFEMVLKALKI